MLKKQLGQYASNTIGAYYAGWFINYFDNPPIDPTSKLPIIYDQKTGVTAAMDISTLPWKVVNANVPPDLALAARAGFCRLGPVQQAVCDADKNAPGGAPESTKNHLGQPCGIVSPGSGIGANAAACFKTATTVSPYVNSSVCGQTLTNFAQTDVDKIKNLIIPTLQSELKKDPTNTVLGLQLTGYQSALSNAADLATQLSKDYKDAYKSTGASSYCQFNPDGNTDLSTCQVEYSWIRGMRVNLIELYREAVESEIQSGVINVTQIPPGSGTAPCGGLAGDLNTLVSNILAEEARIRQRYDIVSSDFNTDSTKGCLGIEQALFSGSPTDPIAAANSLLQSSYNDYSNGPVQPEKKRISHAVCELSVAWGRALAMAGKLANCEVETRTRNAVYNQYLSSGKFVTDLGNTIITPCANLADSKKGLTCMAGCVAQHFYTCYLGKPDPDDGITYSEGVFKFFQDQTRALAPTASVATDAVFTDPATHKAFDVGSLPSCANVTAPAPTPAPIGLSLIGWRWRKKSSRKRARRGGRSSKQALALALAGLAFFAAGCASSGPGQGGCATCQDGSQALDSSSNPICCASGDDACWAKTATACQNDGSSCDKIQGLPCLSIDPIGLGDRNSGNDHTATAHTFQSPDRENLDVHASPKPLPSVPPALAGRSATAADHLGLPTKPSDGSGAPWAKSPASGGAGGTGGAGVTTTGAGGGNMGNGFGDYGMADSMAGASGATGAGVGSGALGAHGPNSAFGGDGSGGGSGGAGGGRGPAAVGADGSVAVGGADSAANGLYGIVQSPHSSLFEIINKRYAIWSKDLGKLY